MTLSVEPPRAAKTFHSGNHRQEARIGATARREARDHDEHLPQTSALSAQRSALVCSFPFRISTSPRLYSRSPRSSTALVFPRLATATRRHADHSVDDPFIHLPAPVCGAVIFAQARRAIASIDCLWRATTWPHARMDDAAPVFVNAAPPLQQPASLAATTFDDNKSLRSRFDAMRDDLDYARHASRAATVFVSASCVEVLPHRPRIIAARPSLARWY